MSHQEKIVEAMGQLASLFIKCESDGAPVSENGNITLRYKSSRDGSDLQLYPLQKKLAARDMPLTFKQHFEEDGSHYYFSVTVPDNLSGSMGLPEITRETVRERASEILERAQGQAKRTLSQVFPENKIAGEMAEVWGKLSAKDKAASRG